MFPTIAALHQQSPDSSRSLQLHVKYEDLYGEL